jgi:hypothetical protein
MGKVYGGQVAVSMNAQNGRKGLSPFVLGCGATAAEGNQFRSWQIPHTVKMTLKVIGATPVKAI